MPGVFISYRREDSSGYAGRLYDILVAHFGRDNIFMDLDTIRGGDNFVTVIEDRIARCDVLLAVIGERWLTASHDGIRRLDQPEDFVRLEIVKALERGVRVIPVLVGAATVPREQDLPPDLRPLALRHAMDLRDAHFREDAQRLIELLDATVPPTTAPAPAVEAPRPKPRIPWLPATTLVFIALFAAAMLLHRMHSSNLAPTKLTPQPATSAPAQPASSQPAAVTPQAIPPPSTQSTTLPPRSAAITHPTTAPPTPKAPEAAAQLSGTWKATVTYDWPGAVYPETFHFEVDGPDLSGTASLLQSPRAIQEGHISGSHITFITKTQTELDDKIYQDKNNYKGTLTGDTIQFTMLTDSDVSEHTPIHFTAHRTGPR